jgi:agmatine/peptidylarginine deiminase
MTSVSFLPEWAPQSAVLLAWPHEETDWADMLAEVHACFSEIIRTISQYERVLLLVPDESRADSLAKQFGKNVTTIVAQTNDTWARDFGPLSIIENGNPVCLDFKFNGWGLKFAANRDNLINKKLFDQNLFADGVIKTDSILYSNAVPLKRTGWEPCLPLQNACSPQIATDNTRKMKLRFILNQHLDCKKFYGCIMDTWLGMTQTATLIRWQGSAPLIP